MSEPTYSPDESDLPDLPDEAVRLLRAFEVLSRLRLEFMADLFASSRAAVVPRERLVRLILLRYAEQRPGRVRDFQTALAGLASRSTVRLELRLMSDLGLVTLHPDPGDGRVRYVRPTRRLITYVATHLPVVAETFRAALSGG